MPTLQQFGFGGPSNPLASPLFDSQRSINLYPERGLPTSKAPLPMVGTPGLQLLGTLPTSPVRQLWSGAGNLYAVAGTHLYQVNPLTGAVIVDFGAMAGSTGTGFCQIVSNGNQLAVCDPTVPAVFFADPIGHVMTVELAGGFYLEYLDGFGFALNAASMDNRVNSSINLDFTNWPPLNFVIRTGVVDQTNGLAAVNGVMWIFGQKNIEVWYDVGALGFPLARIQGGTINTGAISDQSTGVLCAAHISKLNNTVLFLGADDRGYGIAYKTSGLLPVQISTPGIENLLSGFNLDGARSFGYQESGHVFWILNLPNANGGLGATLAFDLTTNLWHERAYYNAGSGNFERGRADCFASVQTAGGSINLVGDYSNGNIYKQSLTYPSDAGAAIKRQRVCPHISKQNQFIKHRRFELDADVGTAQFTVDYSDDGGRTFPGATARTITKSAASGVDTFGRYFGLEWGRSRDRVYRVTVIDAANLIKITNAYVDVDAGIED